MARVTPCGSLEWGRGGLSRVLVEQTPFSKDHPGKPWTNTPANTRPKVFQSLLQSLTRPQSQPLPPGHSCLILSHWASSHQQVSLSLSGHPASWLCSAPPGGVGVQALSPLPSG